MKFRQNKKCPQAYLKYVLKQRMGHGIPASNLLVLYLFVTESRPTRKRGEGVSPYNKGGLLIQNNIIYIPNNIMEKLIPAGMGCLPKRRS